MKNDISVKWVEITPVLAERWLQKNTHNRKIYEGVVAAYALDMKRGLWGLNHQGIAFDEDDVLQDGQHRLSAIVRSGKTIGMWVFRNMPRQYDTEEGKAFTQDTIDRGKTRSIGDQLNISYGLENANLKMAMVGVIAWIVTGKSCKLSLNVSHAIYNRWKNEIEAVVNNKVTMKGLCFGAPLGAFAFAAACFKEKALEFENGYFSGEELKKHSPILVYRQYMLKRDVISSKDYGRQQIVSHALNCLMHFVLGNELKRLMGTHQGIDFFVNKQKKSCADLNELLKL